MLNVDVVVYLACRMSGRSKAVMIKEATEAVATLTENGKINLSFLSHSLMRNCYANGARIKSLSSNATSF